MRKFLKELEALEQTTKNLLMDLIETSEEASSLVIGITEDKNILISLLGDDAEVIAHGQIRFELFLQVARQIVFDYVMQTTSEEIIH